LRLAAARRGLGIHGIRVFVEGERRVIEAHLEVPDNLTLREAHDEANTFEAAVRAELPSVAEIVTHLDPAGDSTAPPLGDAEDAGAIRAEVDAYAAKSPVPWRTLSVELYRVLGEPSVEVTCALSGSMPIVEAHALTDDLEKALRKKFPDLGRVVVHAEPA
jgi:divalent metal cation (Fe/Co/Zn/Cd) transporter